MHFLYNLPLSELHDKEVIKTTVYLHNLLAVLYPPSKQSCLLSFWVRRRKEGSAWTASSLIEVTAAWTFRTVSLVFCSQTSFSWVQTYVWPPPPPLPLKVLSAYLKVWIRHCTCACRGKRCFLRGSPITIAINEKIENARAIRSPRALFFFLPSLPMTKRPLQRREEVTVFTWMSAAARIQFCVPRMWCSFDSGVYIFTWTRQRIVSFS